MKQLVSRALLQRFVVTLVGREQKCSFQTHRFGHTALVVKVNRCLRLDIVPLAVLQERVAAGVRKELLPLTEIPYVGQARARTLYKNGLREPSQIAALGGPDSKRAVRQVTGWLPASHWVQHYVQRRALPCD